VNGLARTYRGRVKFVRVNARDPKNAKLRDQLGFVDAPGFFLLDPQGNVLHQWDEDLSADEVKQVLNAVDQFPN